MKSHIIWNLNWHSASEFWAMGGYGLYVWGSFGMTALVMALELWSLGARRSALRDQTDDDESTEMERA